MGLAQVCEVTVYGGLIDLGYLWCCFRDRDVQFPSDFIEFGQVDPPIDQFPAMGANANQIAESARHALAVGHIFGRSDRNPASDAKDFSRLTGPFVFLASSLEKVHQIATEDQCRPPLVDRRQVLLEPAANGVTVNAQRTGGSLHRIASVNLDPSMIRATCSHRSLAARVNLLLQPFLNLGLEPANGAASEVDRLGERAPRNAKINRAARQTRTVFYARKSQYLVSHLAISPYELGTRGQDDGAIWAM